MTNVDSVLKSGDITLPTKVHIVKAMVFPLVTYGCENWTVKKAEWQKICFCTVVLEKTPESPLDSMDIRPVNLKRDQPWLLTGRTDVLKLKFQYFAYLVQRDDSLEKFLMLGKIEGRRRRGRQRMRWLDGIPNAMSMNLGKLQVMVRDREVWHAIVFGVAKSQTWWGSWTTTGRSKHARSGWLTNCAMQGDAHGLKPLCFSSRLGGNLPALFPCLISRFILSLGKEERETGLCLLVQIGSHCSTFGNTELFFFFLERVHCVWGTGRRYLKRSKLNMEWNEVGEVGRADHIKQHGLC